MSSLTIKDLLCLALFFIAPLLSPALGSQFASAPLRIGKAVSWVAVDDVNHDSQQDLICMSMSPDSIDIFWGNGDGTFKPGPATLMEKEGLDCVAADFDRDGNLDLAIVSKIWLTTLFGRNDGTFTPGKKYELENPTCVLPVDLNGDGRVDLVCGENPNALRIFTNQGDGQFIPSGRHVMGAGGALRLASADLDHDGKLDLVKSSIFGPSMILFGRGDGDFETVTPFEWFCYGSALSISSPTANSRSELSTLNRGGHYLQLIRFEGRRWRLLTSVETGPSPRALALSDFDRDGQEDALVTNGGGSSVTVFYRKGDTYRGMELYPVEEMPTAAAIGDFNSDGWPDAVIANTGAGSLSILLNQGGRTGHQAQLTDIQTRSFDDSCAGGDEARFLEQMETTPLNLPGGPAPASIIGIQQTPDGFYWIASRLGLYRFDGLHFSRFDDERLPNVFRTNRCTCLAVDSEGALWIGTASGLVLLKDSQFSTLSEFDRLGVAALCRRNKGGIWLSDGAAIYYCDHGQKQLLVHAQASSLIEDAHGCLWYGEASKLKKIPDPEHPNPELQSEKFPVAVFMNDTHGNLWVGGGTRGSTGELDRMNPDGHFEAFDFLDQLYGRPSTLAEDKSGALWIGSERGLFRYSRGSIVPLKRTDTSAVLVDKDGNLLVADNSGLRSVYAKSFIQHGKGLQETVSAEIWSIAPGPAGSFFVGMSSGLKSFTNESFTTLVQGTMKFHSVLYDLNLGVLLSIMPMQRFYQGKLEILKDQNGRTLPWASAFYKARDGRILFTADDGLHWISSTNGQLWHERQTLPGTNFLGALEDSLGALWVGTYDAGRVLCSRSNTWRAFDLPRAGNIAPVLSSNQKIWFASENGIWRFFNGSFGHLSKLQGLPDNLVLNIVEDSNGWFWMNCNEGIWRARKLDLENVMDGKAPKVHCVLYERSDPALTPGLTGTTFPNSCRTPDGRIWFPTGHGIVSVDADRITGVPHPPRPIIERVLGSDHNKTRTVTLTAPHGRDGAMLNLPPGTGAAVQIFYTASTLAAPHLLKFRWKLEGQDQDWRELDQSQDRFALYTNLKPGRYLFRLMAQNTEGVWSTKEASVAFGILPFFYQTWGFRLASAGAVLGFAFLAHRRRLAHHNKLQALKHQLAFERERSRIARDIHDDVGATLTRIQLLSDVVENEIDARQKLPEARAHVKKIASSAREVARKMDEIVWAVNPAHDTLPSFVDYVFHFSQEMLHLAGMRSKLTAPPKIPTRPLPAEFRHDIFLLFKEALHNAIKHSQAAEVTVRISLEGELLSLEVSDNGKGIAANIAEGNGMCTMRERARARGASLLVKSDHGVKVMFQVKLP